MEHKRNLKLSVTGIVGLAVGTILLITQSLGSPLQEQSDRVIVALDPTAPLANRSGHAAAISPDGSSIVYVGEREGEQYLYLYSLKDRSTRVIAGSERVRRGPIFSPDGQRFLMIKDHTHPAQIHVIRNWFEELKRLVPTD